MSSYPPPPDRPPPPPTAPGPYPPPPDPPARKRGFGLGVWIAIGVAAVLVLGLMAGGGLYLVKRSSDSAGSGEVITVVTEPVSTGSNPFTPPVPPGGQTTTDVAVTNPVTTTSPVTVKGGNPGLFGGTQKATQCDKAKLIAFLAASPDKAAAWAQVQGISVADIPGFVNGQTSLILRSDTRVTNHGWENGSVTVFQSVLQSGTAVLVNKYGMPTVKCYCGNPLTAPAPATQVTYRGTTWTGWNPQSITVIEQNVTIINDFTVVNVYTNEPFGRPAGSDGASDGPAPSATTAPPPTTPEPTPTPSITSGESASAFVKQAVMSKLRACASKVGSLEEFEAVMAKASFTGAATSDPYVWKVTVSDSSGTFIWTVDSRTGSVTAANADAREIDSFCAKQ